MTANNVDGFGDLLRRARRAASLSQEELAERAGLSARAISDLERGVNRVPRRDTLEMLADALSINAEQRRQWERMRRAAAVRVPPSADHTASATEHPASLLSSPLTTLLGRDQDIAAVSRLLATNRLVTLVGPGGVGKTRLALEVMRHALDDGPAGVHFVPLAAIRDPGLVLSAIAQSLSVSEQAGRTVADALSSRIGDARMLLGLDNLEQVLEAAPSLADLLERHPGLTILTTSRAPLRVRGERVYPVAPLAVPAGGHLPDTVALAAYPAIELFIQRATQAGPSLALTDENAATVAEICRRLDGLPLAIELAAARVTALTPGMILDRLERPLSLLSSGPRDLPDRQQTIRATIEWSYKLLDPARQRLLRWLSVFAGGWTLEAAEAIADGDPALGIDVLDGLMSLIDHNLVTRQERAGHDARFAMLETIREFGLEQLDLANETSLIRQRHAEHIVQFGISANDALTFRPAEIVDWLRRFEAEHDNIRATLGWLLRTGQIALGLRLVGMVATFWSEAGYLSEGRRWINEFLSRSDDLPDRTRLRALARLGSIAVWQGDFDRGEQLLDESLRISRAEEDTLAEGFIRMSLGILAAIRPEPDAALARAYFEQSLALSRELGVPHGETVALNNLGVLARQERDYERAISLFQEALRVAQAHHDVVATEGPLGNLGWISLEWGDHEQAVGYFREALSRDQEGLRPQFYLSSVQGMAHALLACDQPGPALRLLGAVHAIRATVGSFVTPEDRDRFDADVASARARLDDTTAESAWREGARMSIREAMAEAAAARC
jgi:predicted ATPase/DNA-binding XRE family transcriptional regulator